MDRSPGTSRFVAELISLGHDHLLVWSRIRDAPARDAIALPSERGRQVLRSAFRENRDVRAQLLRLYLRLGASTHEQTGVAARQRDFERALAWALRSLEDAGEIGAVRLHVLLRARPRVTGSFLPIVPPPPKPPEPVVPDKLSFLEFEVLDQHGDPLGGVPYEVTFPDGEIRRGRLSNAGYAFIDGVPPGSYHIAFPQAEQPEEEDEADFLDIELVTTEGEPLGGFAYVATFSDGSKWEGVLDENGRAHLAPVPPGDFEVRFPAFDGEEEDDAGGDDAPLEDADGNDNAQEPDDGAPALVASDEVDRTPGADVHDDVTAEEQPMRATDMRCGAPPPDARGADVTGAATDAIEELLP